MENRGKAQTFIGFAIKARKCKIGSNAIQTAKKANLIIVCDSASDNTKKQAEKFAGRFNCPIITSVKHSLEQLTYKENAKVMAITDQALARAIMENIEDDFIARN